jgi:hypothetical protein
MIRVAIFIGTIALAGLMGGCEKPLFSEDLPRTQYERYDRLRSRYVPTAQPSRFGGTEPALRERLTAVGPQN